MPFLTMQLQLLDSNECKGILITEHVRNNKQTMVRTVKQDFRLYLVAKMYYIDGMQQNEIARFFGITPMMLSRLLERAKKEGIVTFQVRSPGKINWEMGLQIKKKYPGLREALVVMTEKGEDSREEIGAVAAEYVQDILKEDDILGISWGKSILSFVNALNDSRFPNVKVVQMSGGFLYENRYEMMPANIVKKASESLGAVPLFLNAPMFVPSESIKNELMKDSLVQYAHELFGKMQISIYGLSDLRQATSMKEVGIINSDEVEELLNLGAVGDVMGYFLNQKGEIVNWSRTPCYMGASLPLAASAPNAICLATDADKANILDIALTHHYANTVILSHDLASALLEQHKE